MPRQNLVPLKFNLNQVFGKIYVSSILKDMIYIIAFFVIFALFLAIFKVSTWIIVLTFLILIGILIFFGYCYNYLIRNNPDLLRSEGYQLNKQQLEMLGVKGKESSVEIIEAKEEIVAIENPRPSTRQLRNTT